MLVPKGNPPTIGIVVEIPSSIEGRYILFKPNGRKRISFRSE